MSKLLQVVYFICYGLAALAIAFVAPKIFPETPHAVAWLAGAVVFLAGALMHEIASRCYQQALDRHRLATLHRAYTEAMEDIDRLAADVRTLKRASAFPAAAAPPPFEAPPAFDSSAVPARARGPEPEREPEPESEPEPEVPAPDIDTGTAEGRLLHALMQRLHGDADGNTASLSGSLIERETVESVREALRRDLLDLYIQPVVTLPQRKTRHVDCEARVLSEGGDYMPPALYENIVEAAGLTLPVRDTLLFRTVQRAADVRQLDPGGYAFCHISPEILSDERFFKDFVAWLRGAGDLTSRVVFEFCEADVVALDEASADALGTLVDLGFHLCISQLQNFDVDAEQLADGGVRFVKVDAEMLLPALGDDTEFTRVRRFKSALDDVRLDLIVTGIANEQLLVELLDLDIELGEGPLFGDPRRGAQVPAGVEGRRGRA
ncbi:MAG: EAL domain-containing protein, partial [Gammaproteobacteria bacterium]|jgi:cyclic-di-GMP phosphodiesterase TipF (flagellum assembly factor)